MISYLDKYTWIAALATFALAVAAQELKRPERAELSISRANVLSVKRAAQSITTNQLTIGKRVQLQVQTNATTITRNFPMMTDALQRSQEHLQKLNQPLAPLTDTKRSLDDAGKR